MPFFIALVRDFAPSHTNFFLRSNSGRLFAPAKQWRHDSSEWTASLSSSHPTAAHALHPRSRSQHLRYGSSPCPMRFWRSQTS